MSFRLQLIDLLFRIAEKPYLARETDVARARIVIERMAAFLPMPPGAAAREVALGAAGLPALRIERPGAAGTLVWLHGGAFCVGSPRTHRALAATLGARAGLAAVLPRYRLAPEHPFPAALDDATAAYRAILDHEAPERLVIGGDSAGGNLAFGLIQRILAAGLPKPAAIVAFSPWLDMTLSSPSLRSLARRDAMLPAARLPEIRDLYLAGADPRDPTASPLFARLEGAPPVLIQASRAEILFDEAQAMARQLRAAGVAVDLELWDAPPHAWQLLHGAVPEADAALDRAADFIARRLAAAGSPAF